MSAGPPHEPSVTDVIEELMIAVFLGLMTLITFANVVVRYIFSAPWFEPVTTALNLPTNLLWSLDTTVFLFAWLVLLGMSYLVKQNAHLGVDVIVSRIGHGPRKATTLFAVGCCILYALLLLKGGWDYWANFASLPQTTGRIIPTGLQDEFLSQAWYEVNDIPMPGWLQWVGDWLNDGDEYEKLPRFIPYTVLPLAFLLLLIRYVGAARRVWNDRQNMIIASHEAEDMLDEVADRDRETAGR